MMKLKTSSAALQIFLLGLIAGVCQAQDFSADVVYSVTNPDAKPRATDALPPQPSKLYVSKNKMRLETHGFSGTVLLVDGDEHTTIALFPERKVYQYLTNRPSDYFRAVDADNACPDWQKASDKKIVCEKLGREDVGGRPAIKYQNKSVSADTSTTAVWIDPALKFVIKWESVDTAAELHNINEGQQPEALFVLPSGYDVLKPTKKSPKGSAARPH
jgi:hypothetical protein